MKDRIVEISCDGLPIYQSDIDEYNRWNRLYRNYLFFRIYVRLRNLVRRLFNAN